MKTLLLLLLLSTSDVTFDRPNAAISVGERITLTSTVTNSGQEPTPLRLAHLNIVSLTPSVYVDPEDWSSDRTQEIEPLEPGESVKLTWPIQAVSAGTFDVYTVLLPTSPGPLTVSPAVRVDVAGRRALDAGGALPVVLAVPLALGLGAGAFRYRLRKNR
ncbi:hypothetical protein SAMN05421504_101372 [Amycolatopsis xylanica]|uniref:Uncharacterized protein n=1 Tax=Amycolatopsis xylanica TaxID=589385 RepID=A0A1H2SW84_9PSEU|nr:hypothetical protein [Amycolatopsis xylanica]SDW35943.1 hypothetical protein SAMN05421504_101372 [Amycolatopsis xylanica]